MALITQEEAGVRFVEGSPDLPLMRRVEDATTILEACFSARASGALLYPANLTAGFFDLSSGEAGAVLQKLRTYGVRLAVVCAPGEARFSRMFGEMASEEGRGGYFRLFESREGARDWLGE